MIFKNKIFWFICAVILGVLIWQQESLNIRVVILVGMASFLFTARLYRYVWAARDARQHVAQQAIGNNKSEVAMWGELVGKTFRYIFLPAAIILVVLLAIAMLINT